VCGGGGRGGGGIANFTHKLEKKVVRDIFDL